MKCDHTDYIEIACTYHYPVTLTLAQGKKLSGTAVDIIYNDAHEECLTIQHEGHEHCIVLEGIKALSVDIDNPHFRFVDFTL